MNHWQGLHLSLMQPLLLCHGSSTQLRPHSIRLAAGRIGGAISCGTGAAERSGAEAAAQDALGFSHSGGHSGGGNGQLCKPVGEGRVLGVL